MEKPKSSHVLSALIGNWGPIGKVSMVEPKEELDDYFYYLPKEIIAIKKLPLPSGQVLVKSRGCIRCHVHVTVWAAESPKAF